MNKISEMREGNNMLLNKEDEWKARFENLNNQIIELQERNNRLEKISKGSSNPVINFKSKYD